MLILPRSSLFGASLSLLLTWVNWHEPENYSWWRNCCHKVICSHGYSHGYFVFILQQSYAQCKVLVLHKLKESMERLFTLDHTNGNGGETTVADIKTAYGLLLRATKLPGALHYKVIAEQVSCACPYTSLLSTYSISTLAHERVSNPNFWLSFRPRAKFAHLKVAD